MRRLLLCLWLTACADKGAPDDTGTADDGGDGGDAGDDGDDGGDPDDRDGDGVRASDGDCNDDDPDVHPGAPERCNGRDDDCDGAPHPTEVDEDGQPGMDCAACDEAGLWAATWAVDDSASLDALLDQALAGTACTDYGEERSFLFLELDNDNGVVEGIYTGATFQVGSTTPDWDVVNTEHTWPRADGAEGEPRECDLHHLFVADAGANGRRGDTPFGEVVGGADWSEGGSKLGEDSHGDAVFEPRDAVKGDIARAILYFAARYADDPEVDVGTQLDAGRLAVFRRWHAADPPDHDEQLRSLRIGARQGVANPFVVCPALVDEL